MARISIAEQHDRNEYVKPDMFYKRCLAKEKKKEIIELHLFHYKNQSDELSHLFKLNPHSSPKEKRETIMGKEKVVEAKEVKVEKTPHKKEERQRGQSRWLFKRSLKGEGLEFSWRRSDEIFPEVLEMLLTEVQAARRIHHK
ncbi:Hypothetical predicted protein [Olea europaea subsp. europaea]|uniref:Uncharacterized protein n=1 Tax=Olea europaea subsp. europaea TaxID=158383 RepID=A0A8S0SEW8_OLEEU|nr:Hypothetical predicted protein [Olea europaea subsp. europaea]